MRKDINLIRVTGTGMDICPGDRMKPILANYSDWQGTFQILEHYDGNGVPEYDKNIPLIIFHSEGDEQWIDINHFSKYGTVLHCNPELAKTKGTFFNYWAYDYLNRIKDYKINLNDNNPFISKFLCLNGNRAWHRYYTLQKLHDVKIFDKGLISLLNRYNSIENISHYDKFKQLYKGDISFVSNLVKDKIILTLDRSNEQIHKDDRSHEQWIYSQSSVSLVTETYGESKRKLFITEKSYKPIANCHFAIWIGTPGIVQFFRDLGFDMFDDVIDHSYDSYNTDQVRFNRAIKSLKEFLMVLPTLDKNKFQERLTANQQKYLNMRISNEEIESWL